MSDEPATAQSPTGREVISTEERRHLIVEAVEKLRDRGVADISMNAITVAIDGTLEKLGVRVADEVYTREEADGMPVCPTCGGNGVEFLTEDERQFFAYLSAQRWRTVVEKDTALRDAKRERWQRVAVWFDPTWKPE